MIHNCPAVLAANECFCDSFETVCDVVIPSGDLVDAARQAAAIFVAKLKANGSSFDLTKQHIAVKCGDGRSSDYQVTLVGDVFEVADIV